MQLLQWSGTFSHPRAKTTNNPSAVLVVNIVDPRRILFYWRAERNPDSTNIINNEPHFWDNHRSFIVISHVIKMQLKAKSIGGRTFLLSLAASLCSLPFTSLRTGILRGFIPFQGPFKREALVICCGIDKQETGAYRFEVCQTVTRKL